MAVNPTDPTSSDAPGDAGLGLRWTMDRESLQGEVDALVQRVFGALLIAAEDLKANLRRETESVLEAYRRQRTEVRGEIERARAELAEVSGALEQMRADVSLLKDREATLAEARAQAAEIIRAAEEERESLLGEVRATQERLRALESQIQQVLSSAPAGARPMAAGLGAAAPPAAGRQAASTGGQAAPTAATGGRGGRAAEPSRPGRAPGVAPRGAAAQPAAAERSATPAASPTPPAAAPEPAAAASTPRPNGASEEVAQPAPAAVVSEPAAASVGESTGGGAAAATATGQPVELVFTHVAGYERAAALERAIRGLPDVGTVEVLEFERGRLVLRANPGDAEALPERVLAGAPIELRLLESNSERATFQVV